MSKTNNKSINYGLKILTILAFAFIFIPFNHAAAAPTYVTGHYNPDGSYTFGDFVWGNPTSINRNESKPIVSLISPKSSNIGIGAKTITVIGNNFTPNSVVRVNASDRSTTFIDSSRLLVQLTANDMYQAEGFYITVFNPDSDNGYSNAAFFTINKVTSTTNTNNNGYNNDTNYNSYTTSTDNYSENTTDTNNKYSTLTSNAIFGSNTFLPSGLVQWILLAIIILVIVILTRKIFGGEKEYHESPMKHA